MTESKSSQKNNRHPLIYILGILSAFAVTLLLVQLIMNPPASDLLFLGGLLLLTSIVSGIVGFVSHRMGWWRQFHTLTLSLTIGYLLAAALTLFNVWLTAQYMFINDHDLALGTVLLIFASGISISFGYFLSASLTQSIREIVQGARQLRKGDFSVRVDVTGQDEIAQLAEAFNQTVAQLEEAEKAKHALDEARRNLVAWASHDLRTPLASLQAMIDSLADGVVDDPKTIARYMKQSQSEIERLNTMIEDLFELTQIDTGYLDLHMESSSLSDLISDTLESFSARARSRNLTLTGAVESDVDPVWMAPDKINRVLYNLLENAMRHTPPGGNIHIQSSLSEDAALVLVQDTGEGIPQKDLPYIFDRFYRREKSRSRDKNGSSGAGLGLAIAKGIVEAHNGQIWAESTPGEGTTMRFTLPKSPIGKTERTDILQNNL